MYFVIDKYNQLGIKHFFFLILLVLYSLLGAWIMMTLEAPLDKKIKNEDFDEQLKIYNSSRSLVNRIETILEDLKGEKKDDSAEGKVLQECKVQVGMEKPELEPTSWNIWTSLFYVTSLYTTVGYGNTSPLTASGRIVTMVYAIIGIPLVISILNDWGNLLFRFVCFVWNNIVKLNHKQSKLWDKCCRQTEIKNLTEDHDSIDIKTVPLSLAFVVVIFYILACAGLYCIWETEWDYFTSIYFFFISFTTIGLGDVTPNRVKYAVATAFFVLFGLAIVSMMLNMIQARLDSIFRDFSKAVDSAYKRSIVEAGDRMGSGKKGLKQIEQQQPFFKRILFQLMGKQKKELLAEQWDHRSNLTNRGIQAVPDIEQMCTQTDRMGRLRATGTQTSSRDCHVCKGGHVERHKDTDSHQSKSTGKASSEPPVIKWRGAPY